MDLHIGDIVGDYRVIEAIGAGGMGAVYKVEHRITKRVEAMKALSTGFGAAPNDVLRFEREIQAQARLQHPNIAAVYSAVQHGDLLALVLEYVEGEPLRQLLERGRLPLETVLRIAADLLAALDCAHRNGVVHGDVSPANILITPSGAAKLTDFGLARDGGADRFFGSGVPVGTAWYMSPEQVRGTAAIDARADIYSAGAVLHEMLTGRKLFDAETAFEVMRGHVEAVPQPPGASNSRVPAALDAAVSRALAKDPGARFQTAGEFRDAIREVAGRRRGRRRVVFAFAALATAGGVWAAILRSHPAPPVSPPAVVQPVAVAPQPVPAPDPAPMPVEPVVQASRPVQVKPSTRRYNVHSSRPQEVTPAAPPPVSVAPESARELPPAPVPADLAKLPGAPRPRAITPAAIPIQTVEEPKPQKTGNRFVRALGKINPFRKPEKK